MRVFVADVVTCDDCGQVNRLPAAIGPGKALVCGRCKKRLDDELDELDEDLDDDQEDE